MTAPQIALSALDAGWSGQVWPPEAASAGDFGVSFEGAVVGLTRRVEVRRSDVQKGYLASKKTADLSAKYTEVSIRVDSPAVVSELKKNCGAGTFFTHVEGGESRFIVAGNVVKVWGSATIVGELASQMQVSDPLKEGDRVKVYTLAGTMLVRSLEILSLAKRTGAMSIMGETHMYGVVQGGPVQVDAKGGMTEKIFQTKANLKPTSKSLPPTYTGNEVADEEWDS